MPLRHLLVFAASLWFGSSLAAQMPPPQVKLVVGADAPLPLPQTFGVPTKAGMTPSGTYAFIGEGSSALFYRPSGGTTVDRILQRGDEIPGINGSSVDNIQNLFLSPSNPICVLVSFTHLDPRLSGVAIVRYNGSSLETVASNQTPFPGDASQSLSIVGVQGINDAGKVAFVGSPRNAAGIHTGGLTLFLGEPATVPQPMARLGDVIPGTTTWFMSSWSLGELNNLNQVLLFAFVNGGSSFGSGLYIATANAPLQKVVAVGDLRPGSAFETFTSLSPTPLLLNNSGQVTFNSGNAIWLYTPGNGIIKAVFPGLPVPPSPDDLGGTLLGAISSPSAISDNGDIVFFSSIAGDTSNDFTTYNRVLFRWAAGTLHSVAYATQDLPELSAMLSTAFDSVSVNASGQVTFRNALTSGGGADAAFFTRGLQSSLAALAVAGADVPFSGGGKFSLPVGLRSRTLSDGGVYFGSNVLNGDALYGEFLWKDGVISSVFSTSNALPQSTTTTFLNPDLFTRGDYATFTASRIGGQAGVFRLQRSTGTIIKVAGLGDAAPGDISGLGPVGGRFRSLLSNSYAVNSSGKVLITPLIQGGLVNTAAYLWDGEAGLSKIVITGDLEAATGQPITVITRVGSGGNPINDAGQVVFSGILSGAISIFLGQQGMAPRKIARGGEPAPGGGNFVSFDTENALINESGDVVFLGLTTIGRGLFIYGTDGTISRAVGTGEAGPAGTTFSFLEGTVSFNNSGELFFAARLEGGANDVPRAGYFRKSKSEAWEAIALDGDLAPAGGDYAITLSTTDGMINDNGDIAFRASLEGGTADSGFFLRRAGQPTKKILLQGETAPGTGTVFATLPQGQNTANSGVLSLMPSGEVILATLVEGSPLRTAIHRYRANGTIEKVLARGDEVPGGGTVKAMAKHLWPGSLPVFSTYVTNLGHEERLYSVLPTEADLELMVTGPSSAGVLTTSSYGFQVANRGTSTANEITLTIPLPVGIEVVGLPPNCVRAGSITCSVASLAPGTSSTFSLGARWTLPGLNPITGTVAAVEPDPVPGNNVATWQTAISDLQLSLLRPRRPARQSSSSDQVLRFQVSGASPSVALAMECSVTGRSACSISRMPSPSGDTSFFEVVVRSTRPMRLRRADSQVLKVVVTSGDQTRSIEISLF